MSKTAVLRDTLELCNHAIERLREAGFVRKYVSMKTEATYWQYPGRAGVLRIAAHQPRNKDWGLDEVHAFITFRGGRHHRTQMSTGPERVEAVIWLAIGQYMVRAGKE